MVHLVCYCTQWCKGMAPFGFISESTQMCSRLFIGDHADDWGTSERPAN